MTFPAAVRLGLVVGFLPTYCALSSTAQTTTEFPLRPPVVVKNESPIEQIIYRQQAYDDRGFNRVIDQVAAPTLTLYSPLQPAHRNAAVVICPGGGYRSVVIDREGHMIARYLQQQGITAVVLNYRLPSQTDRDNALPRPQQDALAAIQYVRQHAAEWGIDARRIGVLGFSAGGHLAGSTAVFGQAQEGSRPDFVAMLYPVVTFTPPYLHAGSLEKLLGIAPTPEKIREFSLEHRVIAGMPPFFLAHARNDTAVPYQNSEMLATALRQGGTPVELLLVDTGSHGFALGRDAESSRWPAAFLNWLDQLP